MDNTIQENNILENSARTRIDKFMKENRIYRNLQSAGISKVRGLHVLRVLTLIFSLVFYGIWQKLVSIQKDK